MGDEVVTTGVDDLLAYLRDKDRIAMQDAANVLGVSLDTLQAWVDFLVEEKILGIEYKFTKPFIYLNREEDPRHKAKVIEQKIIPIEAFRDDFFQRARVKQIPEQKIPELWRACLRPLRTNASILSTKRPVATSLPASNCGSATKRTCSRGAKAWKSKSS
jgi:hypothetical protein